ncbi:hypothetical protein PMG11_01475 [Penicillium brasilianum]|uniref:Clr5 domain-containing protein n=1 Tax=Penicillium brasilianum TaxID=104259 RepID=A0A0F7TI56_PENBI|nr:hypothetical protein PMG11_01475 [Penicillium brasilianum]
MKTSISSDVWEKKKAVIAKLYMEEEWPLKQVIKKIRSDDFNPSETQLRSRLKKWRVTKPSRQTRKKPQGSEDPESEKDNRGLSASPRDSRASPVTRKPSSSSATTRSDWMGQSLYAPAEISQPGKWNTHVAQQLTSSPSGDHFVCEQQPANYSFSDSGSTTTSFEHPAQTSPVAESLMLNTTSAVTPTYAGYPLSPESCIPSPGSTTTPAMAHWPPRSVSADMSINPALHSTQWYGMSLVQINPPSGVPHSAPLAPPPHPAGYAVPPGPGVFSPEFAPYEMPEYHGYDPKQWKRTMSLQYEYAGHHGRPEHERKHINHHGNPPHGMVPFHASQASPHAVMCAPIVPYMG